MVVMLDLPDRYLDNSRTDGQRADFLTLAGKAMFAQQIFSQFVR